MDYNTRKVIRVIRNWVNKTKRRVDSTTRASIIIAGVCSKEELDIESKARGSSARFNC